MKLFHKDQETIPAEPTPKEIGKALAERGLNTVETSLSVETPEEIRGIMGEELHVKVTPVTHGVGLAVLGSGNDNGFDVVQEVRWYTMVFSQGEATDVYGHWGQQIASSGKAGDEIAAQKPLELKRHNDQRDVNDLAVIVQALPDMSDTTKPKPPLPWDK